MKKWSSILGVSAIAALASGQDDFGYHKAEWVKMAEASTPALAETIVHPASVVELVENENAFQGWEAKKTEEINAVYGQSFKNRKSVVVDFGDHYTGTFSMDLKTLYGTCDAPTRFKLTFGEVPAELATPFDPYSGDLSRAWLQDETVTVMHIPSTVTLDRRMSFRYLKIELLGASQYFDFKIDKLQLTALSSAKNAPEELKAGTPEMIKAIDRVSLKTLAECMQTVYEDGPKRDRRLWVGDMYLESIANTVTFKNHQLTKRCLYLLAGLSDDDGYVLGTVFESPEPHAQVGQRLMDYSLLYNAALHEYLKATNDRETAADLWPVAKRQLDIIDQHVMDNGLVDFEKASQWWLFFDWKEDLNKHAAIQGLMIFALQETYDLAEMLGCEDDVANVPVLLKKMKAAALEHFYNKKSGLFESGAEHQVSYASQVWMIMGDVLDRKQSQKALKNVMAKEDAVYPGGPYMYHYFIQALVKSGLNEVARTALAEYWGGMVEKGADTFWEVYDPENDFLSPYHFYPVNSYCHAWSCTPTYFIRKYPEIFQK